MLALTRKSDFKARVVSNTAMIVFSSLVVATASATLNGLIYPDKLLMLVDSV